MATASILFIDIETSYEYPDWATLPELGKQSFIKKYRNDDIVINALIGVTEPISEEQSFELAMEKCYLQKAPLHAEWSKIICMSVGAVLIDEKSPTKEEYIFIRSFAGSELEIFTAFCNVVEKMRPDTLCAHNGKPFDYPFLCRRMLINGFEIPEVLNVGGLKPWEIKLIDTVEMWKFSDVKYYVSLITLAYVFGLESPKEDMDGSEVPAAYYRGEIERIRTYCNRDVYTLINVYRSLKALPIISRVQIAAMEPVKK